VFCLIFAVLPSSAAYAFLAALLSYFPQLRDYFAYPARQNWGTFVGPIARRKWGHIIGHD
jgi:hypothetical protein